MTMLWKSTIYSSNNAFSKETVKQQPRNNSTNVPANISEDLATGDGGVNFVHEVLQPFC